MSKNIVEALQGEGAALLFLLPEEIQVDDDILRARPMYDLDLEQAEIEDLAKSIQETTQLEPVVVRPALKDEDGGWHLVAGRRRRDAAMLINAGKSSKEEQFRLSAVVKQGIDKDEAFRMAIAENLKRKNLNTVQLGLIVQELRKANKWEGGRGTKKVAEFMQVSPATITQAEKVLTLPKESQDKVAKGEWSAQTAFEFLNTKPDMQKTVEDVARGLQEAEDDPSGRQDSQNSATGHPGKKKKALKAKHVRTASRQHGAAISLKPLNRAEIIDFFIKIQSPAYGFPNGDIHVFAKTFVMWCEGKIKDQTLKGHFDKMVMKADRGKADKVKIASNDLSKDFDKGKKKAIKKAKKKK